MVYQYSDQADVNLETAKMEAALILINTGEDHIGWMRPEIWVDMVETLSEESVLSSPLDVSTVYTTKFLEEKYSP